MDISNKLEDCMAKKKYVRLTRKRGDFEGYSSGYIVDYSNDFLLLRATDNFGLDGYNIFPNNTIQAIRNNRYDKFYDKIMKWEGHKDGIEASYTIDLSDWKAIFQALKKTKLTVTIECEEPHMDYFNIGTLQGTGKKQVSLLYFTPDGIVESFPTITKYENITKVSFDDRYANTLTKYARPEKPPTRRVEPNGN